MQPGEINIINQNKAKIEQLSRLADQFLLNMHSDIHSPETVSLQENDEIYLKINSISCLLNNSEDSNESAVMLDETSYVPVYSGPSLMPNSELNSNAWKLNQKQCQLFDILHISAGKG